LSTAPTDFDTLADLFLDDVAPRASSTRIGPAAHVWANAGGSRENSFGPDLPGVPPAPQSLRIGPAQPRNSPVVRTADPPASAIEVLVLGHLPVLASSWVMPYVRQRSIELRRPLALVRLTEGECTLDVVAATPSDLPPSRRRCETLEEAIRLVAPHMGGWVLRVSEVAEQETIASPRIAAITLLTGADEAATVASYRTLKNLPERAAPANVRLAIMGSSPEVARAAEHRIRHAAQAYLETTLGPATIIGKITSGGLASVYAGEFDWTLARLFDAIATASAAEPVAPVVVVPAAEQPPPTAVEAPHARSVSAAAVGYDHALPGHIEIKTRCPYAPEVGLWTDPAGDLHLSITTGRGTPFTDPGMGVQRLLTVASWASDHASLLAAVHAGLRPEAAQTGASLHLLTDEPKDVRRLFDTGVRLHLLVEAESASGPIRVCRDLN